MVITQTGTVLDRIVTQTAKDLDSRKELLSRAELLKRLQIAPPVADVLASLRRETVAVISEVKRASPSKGRFPVEVEPFAVATAYAAGGAAMISCLTDEPFFQGSLADLDVVVTAAIEADPPIGVLRKDFIIDEYQIDEARVHGASCVLLMASVLDDAMLQRLHDYVISLGMIALVEVHDEIELARVLTVAPRLVGINNRNLKTLTVDLAVTERLAPLVPAGIVLAGESGIFTAQDVARMAAAGVDAVLVGESLIVQPDRSAAVRSLTGVEKSARG